MTPPSSAKASDIVHEIYLERARQIFGEGWTPEHDDRYCPGELAVAAACYATHGTYAKTVDARAEIDAWPWGPEWDKRDKHPPRRRLVIAAALLVAAIERIDRAEPKPERGPAARRDLEEF